MRCGLGVTRKWHDELVVPFSVASVSLFVDRLHALYTRFVGALLHIREGRIILPDNDG